MIMPKNRAVDEIHAAILSHIIRQKLGPGDRINVDAMARQFQVSQTPIRQALERLLADGMVVSKPNSGFRVSDLPSKDHLLATLDFRCMFETELVQRAALQIDSDAETRIRDNINALEQVANAAELDQFKLFEVDGAFHDIVASISGNEVAAVTLKRLITTSSVFRFRYQAAVPQEIFEEHECIAKAILDRDPSAAANAMREHLEISRDRVAALKVPSNER